MLGIVWHRMHLLLTAELFIGEVDLFYSSDFVLPPLRHAKAVVTVHDLSFLVLPECAEVGLKAYLSRAVPRAVRRADLVLADSIHTKNDLVNILKVPSERVVVLYSAVEDNYKPVEDEEIRQAVTSRLRLNRPFLLTVGTLEPRKNLIRLLEAFAVITQTFPHELLIVGRPGWMYQGIYDAVHRLDLQNRVRFMGFVPEDDLPVLYSLADLFVYPSLYEGFGLPPLEAMACGVPVVCSNASSLPEVTGDAALAVDPRDTGALIEALRLVMADSSLRKGMVAKGIKQAARFSWSDSAQQLVTLFEGLA
jgi:glycosyltransferase involved in cell wall biosynthesis